MRLKFAGTALAAVLMAATSITPKCHAEARYIFYFIGDGMGLQQVTDAGLFKKHVLGSDEPLLMTTFPFMTMATTQSANSDVTDSAAAGTALACGVKTGNGMLGVTPDSAAVTSVAKTLFDRGYGIGIVTSVAIDDATPGAFYTHVPYRGMFYDTGRFLAESGYQFFAGAGLRGTRDKDGNDNGLISYITDHGYRISYGVPEESLTGKQLILGPLHESSANNIGFTVDSLQESVTLQDFTRAGLEHLKRTSPERFFMMVEGGNIDHAGHSNDGGAVVREVINFDKALGIAYDFYLAHPDETLIVVTADHETGGMSVGCRRTGYSTRLENAAGQRVSKDTFNAFCQKISAGDETPTWEAMTAYMNQNLGYGNTWKPDERQRERLAELFNEVFVRKSDTSEKRTLYGSYNTFTDTVFEMLNSDSGMGWTTGSHTGTPVPVFAIGAGSSQFTGFPDNTDLPRMIEAATR